MWRVTAWPMLYMKSCLQSSNWSHSISCPTRFTFSWASIWIRWSLLSHTLCNPLLLVGNLWTTNCSYLVPPFPSQEFPLSRHRIPWYSSSGPLNPICSSCCSSCPSHSSPSSTNHNFPECLCSSDLLVTTRVALGTPALRGAFPHHPVRLPNTAQEDREWYPAAVPHYIFLTHFRYSF